MLPLIGDLDPAQMTPQTVTGLVATLNLKPSSMRPYIATLRAILDYTGVDPNPARDARVRLAREEHEELEPPSSADVAAIVTPKPCPLAARAPDAREDGDARRRAPCARVRDVDEAGTAVPLGEDGRSQAVGRCPSRPHGRDHRRRTIAPPNGACSGATPLTLKNVIRRACKTAGIAQYSPHDLRHRYPSVQVARGVSLPMVAAQLGRSRQSLTPDTYSHVLVDDENEA